MALSFIEFNNGVRFSHGLAFSFSRAVATRDYGGNAISSGSPRYHPEVAWANPPAAIDEFLTAQHIRFKKAGVDLDGTPMAVVANESTSDIFVCTAADLKDSLVNGTGRVTTALSLDADTSERYFPTVSGGTGTDRYVPAAWLIIHGTVLALCRVLKDVAGTFDFDHIALIKSIDNGTTWSFVWEEGATRQRGVTRIRQWAMQNWYDLNRTSDPPLEVWVPFSDYRDKTSGATGGTAFLTRLTRANSATDWTIATPAEIKNIETGDATHAIDHIHTAAVVPFGASGLRLLVPCGDGQNNNSVVSMTIADKEDWQTPANWTAKEDYHGKRAAAGYMAHQWVGCSPSHDVGKILCGADENRQMITSITPDASATSKAIPRFVYGPQYSSGPISTEAFAGYEVFRILCENPSNPARMLAYMSNSGTSSGNANQQILLVSDDGGQTWCPGFQPRFGDADSSTPIIHNGYIYYAGSATGGGNKPGRIPFPTINRASPLAIGPGGTNLQASVISVTYGNSSTNTIALLANAGQTGQLPAGIPEPPGLGQIFHLHANDDSTSGQLCALLLSASNAATLGQSQSRIWACIPDWDGATYPDSVESELLFKPGTTVSDAAARVHRVVPHGKWFPILCLMDTLGTTGNPWQYKLVSKTTGTIRTEFSIFYALDTVLDGAGYPGYPLAPATSCPDEVASISGLGLGASWSLITWVCPPFDGWDVTAQYQTTFVLCTLWQDANNYVELWADTANSTLLAKITEGGSLVDTLSVPVTWMREGVCKVGVVQDGTTMTLYASARGAVVSSDSGTISGMSPDEMRMSNNDQTVVESVAHFGAAFDRNVALSESQIGSILFSGQPRANIWSSGVWGDGVWKAGIWKSGVYINNDLGT